ncbi:MAG: hypothetical protein ACJ71Z_05305 [Aeromicrobium sp.]
MRLIARKVAAVVAIVLGLACVSLAAFGSGTTVVGPPPAPDDEPKIGSIPPIGPRSGVKADSIAGPSAPRSGAFDSEFGQRGNHEVTVVLHGHAFFDVEWRDKKSDKGATLGFRKTRTVKGGFPLAQVAVQAYPEAIGSAGCSITIDGHEKDAQVTSKDQPIVFCQA